MKKALKIVFCVFLSLLMVISAFPAQAFAEALKADRPEKLKTVNGDVEVSDDWDTEYPYGCFAFENSEALLQEGGDTVEISVYRLGGTYGRATAILTYNPMITPAEKEEDYGYSIALSNDDIDIEIENTSPAAMYDPIGKDPDPEECGTRISKTADGSDMLLSVSENADKYLWQMEYDGKWKDIKDSDKKELRVSKEDSSDYEFRCIYTVNGTSYCTYTSSGKKYVKPEEEVLPSMPADVDLSPKPTYTKLTHNESDPYSAYEIALTFADGEWKKTLRLTAKEDNISECVENSTLIISDNEGGAVNDAANTMSVLVQDNDPAEPFEIGLTETKGSFDKADGKAVFTVRRTGGNQIPVTVAYETVDGTAKKGVDYIAATGDVTLYGDVREMNIEIQLIDDGKVTDRKKDLKLRLTKVTGDSEGLCTLKNTEASVYLYNSGKGDKKNLATALMDGDAIDLSDNSVSSEGAADISPDTVSGTQYKVEPVTVSLSGDKPSNGGTRSFRYPNKLEFNPRDYRTNDYWKDTVNVYTAGYRLTGKSNVEFDSNSLCITTTSGLSGKAHIPVDYMSKVYTRVYGNCVMLPYKGGVCPWIAVGNTNSRSSYKPEDYTSPYVAYTQSDAYYNAAFDVSSNLNMIIMGFNNRKPNDYYITQGVLEASELKFKRRTFEPSAGFYMTVHTANDGVSTGLGNVVTAPEGAPAFNSDSDIYKELMPEVSIIPGNGGMPSDGSGNLYVGTQLKVSLRNTATFSTMMSQDLSAAVYLTRENGQVVAKGEKLNDKDYSITLVWDNMTAADLSGNYVINVVMTRKHTLTIDLSPSIPRKDDGMTADMSKAGDTVTAFLKSISGSKIAYGASAFQNTAPYFSGLTEKTVDMSGASPPYTLNTSTGSLNIVINDIELSDNIQWINLNCNKNDKILFNGNAYDGDEKIWLKLSDLNNSDIHLYYYSEAFLSIPSIMNTSVDKIGLYWDGDANGRIDGDVDEQTGFFNLKEGSKDKFIKYFDPKTNYIETDFNPQQNVEHKNGQMFLKIYYYMNPRSLSEPSGDVPTAQVTPAFTTSITDSETLATLTEQQRNYRYLISGAKDGSGNYTSDGHPMFKAEATAIQYVDVPLGGDTSPVVTQTLSNGKVRYTWDPHYIGNLMRPYTKPEPIYIEESLAGKNIPLAPGYDTAGGPTQADIDNLNGYLGSFAANTTVALCVRQQDTAVGDIISGGITAADAFVSKADESSTLIGNCAIPDPNANSNAQTDSDLESGFDTSSSGNKYSEFNVGLVPRLDTLNVSAMGISVAKKGDEIIIGASLPLSRWQTRKPKSADEDDDQQIYHLNTKQAESEDWDKFTDAFKMLFGSKQEKTAARDDLDPNYNKAKAGQIVFCGCTATISAYVGIHLKYDQVRNKYDVYRIAGGINASISAWATARLTICPIFYVTSSAGATIDASIGLRKVSEYKENPNRYPLVGTGNSLTLQKGEYHVFEANYRMFNLQFEGQIGLSLYTDKQCTKQVDKSKRGQLTSKSKDDKLTLNMMRTKGYPTESSTATYYLKIQALEKTTIHRLAEVSEAHSGLKWDGFQISPSMFYEVAAGIDVWVAKAEVAIRISVGASFSILSRATASGEENTDFKVNSAELSIAGIVRAKLLFFNYSFTLAGFTVSYDGNTNKWSTKFTSDFKEKKRANTRGVDYDSAMSLPDDASDTQRLYKQQEVPLSLRGFMPSDDKVPFELTGYSSASDAAKLADGLMGGSDYQVISFKNAQGKDVNYVLYHISRDAQSTLDNSMLVLSELRMTGVSPGLVNPVNENSFVPYIPVDDDGTGDLDFHIAPTEDGSSLRVTWCNYSKTTDASAQANIQTFSSATKNTEIKTAYFTPGQTEEHFTGTDTVCADNDEFVGKPITTGDATVYIRTNHIDDNELLARTERYSDYLKNIGYDINGTDENAKQIAQYRISTQRAVWAETGSSSDIFVKISRDPSDLNAQDIPAAYIQLSDGVTVENIAAKKIGNTYYIAYTTGEYAYTDSKGVITDDDKAIVNMLSIKRMYLRTFTVKDGEIVWGMDGKAVLLRTLYDYDDNGDESVPESVLYDGVYAGGEIVSHKNSPYFTNLQFLNAKLGDKLTGAEESLPLRGGAKSGAGAEDFLLFDMNGSTYLIRQASLETMTGSGIKTDGDGNMTTGGTIIPFFTPDASETAEGGADAPTGRLDTTIGADGDGNLVAVCTSTVPNTTDTALCISKYDPETGWGSKTVLAMNHLSVYEDNIKLGREGKDAENAYLGLLDSDNDGTPDSGQKGSMDFFTFSKPQIALGNETVTDSSGRVEQKPTLLVLTQGTMNYYGWKEVEDEDHVQSQTMFPLEPYEVTASEYPRSVNAPAGSGFYALAYGVGTQGVGNAMLSMKTYDFSAGSNKDVTVRFENTGDIGIRGSEDQPITVSLMASDYTLPLATWTITENIIPGQKAVLSGELDLLTTLPVGTELFLNVREDDFYAESGGTPFNSNTNTMLTVEEYPELSITDNHIVFDSVDDDGNAVIDVEFMAGNRGTSAAQGVKAVFSYDTGEVDENGNVIYDRLDITGNDLHVTTEALRGAKGAAPDQTAGELDLSNIETGYGQHVKGTITVPPQYFNERSTGALNLKIELFSAGDSGLPEGEHREYNSTNNVLNTHIEHEALFSAPARINIPAGNELRIPIDCKYSTGEEIPHIVVAEFPDIDGDTHFGVHAFRYGEFEDGTGHGTIELVSESEGSGYLRIKDINTNSYYDIAYSITPAEPGININEENNIFTFHNRDNSVFDVNTEDVDWRFEKGVTSWGADGTAPYMNDLANGVENSYFTFSTVAESIDLVFDGEVTVASTFEGYGEPRTITASGGDGTAEGEYASIVFGRNLKGTPHTVTVTVTGGTEEDGIKRTRFDRLIEHYNQNQLPIPDDDQNAPQIFFDRSFPDTSSVAEGTKVDIKAYVFDETGVASVSLDSKKLTSVTKKDVKFWIVDLSFTENGTYTIATLDDLGNRITNEVLVDWFSKDAQGGAPAVPEVSAQLVKRAQGADTVLTDDVDFTDDEFAYIKPSGTASDGSGAADLSVTEVTVTAKDGLVFGQINAIEDGYYPANSNGWYLAKAQDPDSDRWSVTVVDMMRLTQNQLIIKADDVNIHTGDPEPELTYRLWGLLPGENMKGSLVRQAGADPGEYTIAQGTLAPENNYKVFFTGAKLYIGHLYGDPTWEWKSRADNSANTVVLNMADISVADIHPGYYSVNGGQHVERSSANTRYTVTGTGAGKIVIHDGEGSPAVYNICLSDAVVTSADDFMTVNGSDAVVNLLLSGNNSITSSGSVFSRGSTYEPNAKINIAVSGSSTSSFRSGAVGLANVMLQFSRVGDCNIAYPSVDSGSFRDIYTNTQMDISGGSEDRDPFKFDMYAVLTAECTSCSDKLEQEITPVREVVAAGCLTNEYVKLTASFTADGYEFTDVKRYETMDSAAGHHYGDPQWSWAEEHASATATFTCPDCGNTVVLTDTAPVKSEVAAGCETDAFDLYTAKVSLGGDGQNIRTGEDRVYKTGTATGHHYDRQSWTWTPIKEEVSIVMTDGMNVSIHPGYYTVNGTRYNKDCTKVRYFISGSPSSYGHLTVHDNEYTPTTYDICLDGLSISTYNDGGDFLVVNGNGAVINLTIRNQAQIQIPGRLFGVGSYISSGSPDLDDPVIKIAMEHNSSIMMRSWNNTIANGYISFQLLNCDSIQYLTNKDINNLRSDNHVNLFCVTEIHNPFGATWSATGTLTCSGCGKSISVSDNDTTFSVVSATCERGIYTRYHATVTVDGQTYEDEKKITQPEIYSSASHNYYDYWGNLTAIWHWADDYSSARADFKCQRCGLIHSEYCNNPTAIHTAPTCDTDGRDNYIAKVTFKDKEFTDEKQIVDKNSYLRHNFGEPSWTWKADHTEATVKIVCARCGYERSVTDTSIEHEYHAPTCTANAYDTYTADTQVYVFGSSSYYEVFEFSTSADVEQSGTALGHRYENPVWTWADDHNKASIKVTCSTCGDEQTAADNSPARKPFDPTCTEDGYDMINASVTIDGRNFSDEIREDHPRSALGHSYGDAVWEWNADHSAATATVVCSRCSDKLSGTDNNVYVQHNDATCLDDAYDLCNAEVNLAGVECFDERRRFDMPGTALGHDYIGTFDWADDLSSAECSITCSRCDLNTSVHAEVTNESADGRYYVVATAGYDGKTYTDRQIRYFIGHSLSLSGDIGVNFYLGLTEQEIADGATVDFAWTVEGKEKTRSVTLTTDDATSNGYKASCPIAVAEMTYDITATVTVGEVSATDIYSAAQYADTILTDSDFIGRFKADNGDEKYAQLTAMVKSMLDYGAKAQTHFKRNEDKLANSKLTADDDKSPYYYAPPAVSADSITGATEIYEADFGAYGLEYVGTTIVYLTETSIRHYFKIVDKTKFNAVKGNITFGGDTPIGYTVKDKQIYFELKNISAPDLDTLYTLKIGESENDYSAMDYVKACLDSEKTTDTMKALAAATYLYNQAANAYFGS